MTVHDKASGTESWWHGLVTEIFWTLTPCRGRSPALSGTAGRCPIKGLQIKVWSGSTSSDSNHCAADAACVQLLQLIEGSAFVRSRCSSSSYIEHDGPAEPRIVAGAAELVENGPCATGSIALVRIVHLKKAGKKAESAGRRGRQKNLRNASWAVYSVYRAEHQHA